MFGGKEGHTNIQISAEPGIEPGTLWLEGRDLIPTAPTTPPLESCLSLFHSISLHVCRYKKSLLFYIISLYHYIISLYHYIIIILYHYHHYHHFYNFVSSPEYLSAKQRPPFGRKFVTISLVNCFFIPRAVDSTSNTTLYNMPCKHKKLLV